MTTRRRILENATDLFHHRSPLQSGVAIECHAVVFCESRRPRQPRRHDCPPGRLLQLRHDCPPVVRGCSSCALALDALGAVALGLGAAFGPRCRAPSF